MPPPFTTSAPWLFSKPLHVLGERQHVLGQQERGWREVGRKEVRKVEEMRGVEGGGGGEEGLEGGVWGRIRLVDGGREGGDYRIPKNSEERNSGDERDWIGGDRGSFELFSKHGGEWR